MAGTAPADLNVAERTTRYHVGRLTEQLRMECIGATNWKFNPRTVRCWPVFESALTDSNARQLLFQTCNVMNRCIVAHSTYDDAAVALAF